MAPLAGRERQHVEDRAVEQPQGVHAQVPPAGKPDRVPDPGQPDLTTQADGVLLRCPERVGGNRFLDAEPVFTRGAVPRPVQPRVVAEDLDAGADDEDQQEQVEEVLHANPDRQSRMGHRAGLVAMKCCTPGAFRRPLPMATATISTTKPIGSSHSRLTTGSARSGRILTKVARGRAAPRIPTTSKSSLNSPPATTRSLDDRTERLRRPPPSDGGLPHAGRDPAELPAAPAASLTPEAVTSLRSQLTIGEDVVDASTWAGSVPVAHGIAPRMPRTGWTAQHFGDYPSSRPYQRRCRSPAMVLAEPGRA
jgi:hypothetical protein